MNAPALLAQTPPAVDLVRGDVAHDSRAWILVLALALAACGVAAALFIASRRELPRPTPHEAYRALIRRMRIGRAARGLLADLAAAHGSATPLALIGSGSAFAASKARLGTLTPRRARTLVRLEMRLARERRRIQDAGTCGV